MEIVKRVSDMKNLFMFLVDGTFGRSTRECQLSINRRKYVLKLENNYKVIATEYVFSSR